MYVNPFWFGVMTTLLVEVGLIIALVCCLGGKKK